MGSQITPFGITALGLAVIGCFSLPTLLGLWLAKSRLHWVFPSLLILAIASPLMTIRAFDLMLIVIVNAWSVFICSRFWLRRQNRKQETVDTSIQQPRFQFKLHDGLAAFLILAVIAAMWAQIEPVLVLNSGANTIFWGVCQCVLIGLAAAIWGTSLLSFKLKLRYWALWVALLAASSVAAAWNEFAASAFSVGWSMLINGDFFALSNASTVSAIGSIVGWSILLAVHGLAVALVVSLFQQPAKQQTDNVSTAGFSIGKNWIVLGKRMLGVVLLLMLSISVALYVYILIPPPAYSPIRKIVRGEPNSFPDVVATGKAFSAAGLSGWPPVNPGPVLAAKLQAETKHFDDVELGLQAENCYVMDWDVAQFDFDDSIGNTSAIRDITRALSTRALQSLSEGQSDDVVEDGLLSLKLSEATAIDGVLISSLVGTACEGIGVETIVSGIDNASDEQLRKAADQLTETIALFGTIDAEMERLENADKYLMANMKDTHWLVRLALHFTGNPSRDPIRMSLVRRNVKRSLLQTEIAIRLYRSKFGHPPEKLESLVPEFLDEDSQ